MSEFMDEAKQARWRAFRPVDQGLDQAEQVAEQKTGGQFDSEIQAGDQQAEGFLGADDQGNQNANQ